MLCFVVCFSGGSVVRMENRRSLPDMEVNGSALPSDLFVKAVCFEKQKTKMVIRGTSLSRLLLFVFLKMPFYILVKMNF